MAVILSVSTVLESVHGTPFAQANFYQAHWFDFFLGLVWINIFCATLTRWPFKKKHVGFVITHIGILTLLLGSLGTRLFGSEGQMTLFEEQAKSRMLGTGFTLRVTPPGGEAKKFDLKTAPVKRPAELPLENSPVRVALTRVFPHAEETRSLAEDASAPANRAVQAVLSSEMLGFTQELLLIEEDASDPQASSRSVGPATFILESGKKAPALLRLTQASTGKSFSFALREDADKVTWKETGLTLSNLRYFPRARIENDRLVDLEKAQHLNPAVEFEVSDGKGRSEHHTRFSFFPEFDSLRGGEKNDVFGLKVALEPPAEAHLKDGPSFRFLVSDANEWRWQVRSSRSGDSEIRPLVLNEPIRTGWMDMTVTAKRTFEKARILVDVREDPSAKSATPAVELSIRREGMPAEKRRLLMGRSLLIGPEEAPLRIDCEPKTMALPFSLGLADFRKIDYPGTSNPASFESDVVLRDTESGLTLTRTISMNKPLDHKGWRVFQSSYIQDERLGEASVFTLAKNPGMPAIYAGAALILIGVILLFYFHPFFTGKNLAVALIAFGALCGHPAHAADAEQMRSVPVQHNGRVKPFDSFARQTLKLVAGKESWQKEDASAFFTRMLAEPSKIADIEWIRVEFGPLKKTLDLAEPKKFFSLNELFPSKPAVEELVQSSKDKRDRDLRPSQLEQKAEELYTKIRTVEALIGGENFTKLPPGAASKTRLDLELLYNKLKPFEQAALLYFLAFFIFLLPKKSPARERTGFWLVTAAFIFHTIGLVSRVYILSRPPVSNMYESMVFMNWALAAFALGFAARGGPSSLVLGAGAAVSGFVMLYANLLPIDPSLDVVVAVLRSNYWLTVHVLTVVSSYGAFGLAMGLGHRHLFLSSVGKLSKKAEQDSARLIFRIIQLGTLLIGTGTFLGGVWANESWGRFWGWDPKETWALITFLGYLLVVHLRYARKIPDFYLAFASVIGFQLVLMTWYGVNFVLGRGLHSYGAGTGGMRWVVYFLVFEALFAGWALLKRFAK